MKSPDFNIGTVVPLSATQVAKLVALYNANQQPAIEADAAFVIQIVDNEGTPGPKVFIGLFLANCLQGVVAIPFERTPELGA